MLATLILSVFSSSICPMYCYFVRPLILSTLLHLSYSVLGCISVLYSHWVLSLTGPTIHVSTLNVVICGWRCRGRIFLSHLSWGALLDPLLSGFMGSIIGASSSSSLMCISENLIPLPEKNSDAILLGCLWVHQFKRLLRIGVYLEDWIYSF